MSLLLPDVRWPQADESTTILDGQSARNRKAPGVSRTRISRWNPEYLFDRLPGRERTPPDMRRAPQVRGGGLAEGAGFP